MKFEIKLSENLRRLMDEKGLNQPELSRKSGIDQPNISRYLNRHPEGKTPTLKHLVKLADALDVSLDELGCTM
nr:helix-turn-helix transcriptional regulator [candidate division Zixibacteria bacterium]